LTQSIPEGDSNVNIPADRKYPKLSKATSGYLEKLNILRMQIYIQDTFAITVHILSKIITVQ
jgi:hypothetical protein